MSRILLVTGSRALDLSPAARAWAENILRLSFSWWQPELLVHGGCPDSPDAWAHEMAKAERIATRVFLRDGAVEKTGALRWAAVGLDADRWTSPEHLAAHPPEKRPLLRNRAMVGALTINVDTGDAEVLCVGLGAPWATTRGTENTVTLAKASRRMRVEYRPCPTEFGP